MQSAIAQDDIVGRILDIVRLRTGVDFRAYRAATIRRRIANRMSAVGIPQASRYLQLLEGSTPEADLLLGRLAVRVSNFYRNAPAFDALRETWLPALAAAAPAPLRLWSAGCGEGEEPFTLAMLLASQDSAGEVLATDIDAAALARARAGGPFAAASARELPGELAARFLVPDPAGGVHVAPAASGRVRFARHDLLAGDPPTGGAFDLVACRNVVIYLERPARDHAFATLVRALRPGGLLFLGEAEWPPEAALRQLEPLAGRHRLFRRAGSA